MRPRPPAYNRTTRIAFTAVVATVACLLSAIAPTAQAASPRHWKSGVFAGYLPSADEAFATWRGAPVQTATEYLESADWQQIEDPAWDIRAWREAPSIQPVLTVPLWPGGDGSLAGTAAGAYNGHFAAMARHLVAGGLGSAIIRLGWEFNGNWYPWSVQNAAEAKLFAKAWRQIVGTIQRVRGGHFSFDWSMTVASGGLDPALAYPGNAYVSSIGMDVYDLDESAPGESPSRRWSEIVNLGYGLAWQARFAAAHHKPVSFAEWAVAYELLDPSWSGGDDPTFIQNMYDWFAGHDTAFEDYFDVDSGLSNYGLTTGSGQFPDSTALYRSLYSGSTYSP
jgi:hypothetical protein